MATTGDSALFVDTNVLVYANVAEAPHHAAALAAIETAREADRTLWISRQVLREYLVIMTRPQSFETLDGATVLNQIRQFLDLFEVADESAAVTERLIALMTEVPISGKQVHDANIVATLLAYGIPTLVTHNTRDFVRFGKHIRFESIE